MEVLLWIGPKPRMGPNMLCILCLIDGVLLKTILNVA